LDEQEQEKQAGVDAPVECAAPGKSSKAEDLELEPEPAPELDRLLARRPPRPSGRDGKVMENVIGETPFVILKEGEVLSEFTDILDAQACMRRVLAREHGSLSLWRRGEDEEGEVKLTKLSSVGVPR